MTKQECLKLPKSCLECKHMLARLLDFPCDMCNKYSKWEWNYETV